MNGACCDVKSSWPSILIVDELGYVPLSKTGAEWFEVFSQRYEQGSTLVTSNLPNEE